MVIYFSIGSEDDSSTTDICSYELESTGPVNLDVKASANIPVDTNIPTLNTDIDDIAVDPLVDANNNNPQPQERAGVQHTGAKIQHDQKRLNGESYFNTIGNDKATKKMGSRYNFNFCPNSTARWSDIFSEEEKNI